MNLFLAVVCILNGVLFLVLAIKAYELKQATDSYMNKYFCADNELNYNTREMVERQIDFILKNYKKFENFEELVIEKFESHLNTGNFKTYFENILRKRVINEFSEDLVEKMKVDSMDTVIKGVDLEAISRAISTKLLLEVVERKDIDTDSYQRVGRFMPNSMQLT